MPIEAAIFSRLSNFAGLSTLVSNRITPGVVPQNETLPAVSFRTVSEDRPSAMGVDIGIVFARFQFDAWAVLYDDARAVAEQLRGALQRWRGTEAGVVIQDSFILSRTDLFLHDVGEPGLHHIATDARIIYEE